MKKLISIVCVTLLLFGMCGCSDATTNVSDKNTALITVGNEKITKGDVYDGLNALGDISYITEALDKAIAAKAVETTEEIESEAKKTLDVLKTNNKDWEQYLTKNGFANEEELMADLIVQVKQTKITAQYVSDEYETLAKRLEVRKVQVVACENQEKADTVMKKAKEGSELNELAKTYGTNKYNGETTIYTNESGLPAAVWTEILATVEGSVAEKIAYDAATASYFVVKVVDTKTNTFKEEAIPAISSLKATNDEGLTMDEEAFKFFLNKFNYSIHDATVYSSLLNQSIKYERIR